MTEKIFPITWKAWDEVGILTNQYYDVEFIDEFGEFKKGDKFKTITINYSEGIIEAYNESGKDIIKTQNWTAKPILEN